MHRLAKPVCAAAALLATAPAALAHFVAGAVPHSHAADAAGLGAVAALTAAAIWLDRRMRRTRRLRHREAQRHARRRP